MRILLIHQYYLEQNDAGGSRWNEMTRMWADQGHEITVLAGMVHYATGKKSEKYQGKYFNEEKFGNNINVWRCHVSEAYNINFLGRLWAYFSFVFSSIWAGFFKIKTKHDIIIVTSPPLFVGITAYVLSIFKRIPFVFEIRDLWPESAIDTGVLQNKLIIKLAFWFENFIYKKAKLINVLTPAFKMALIEKKFVPENKIIYIPNAADFSLSDELLENFDVALYRKENNLDGKTVITYVGAHGVANNLIQIIQTAELIKDTNVLFLLIGDGMEKNMLKNETMKRGLENVRFIDSVPKREVFKYILASDMGTSVLKKVDTFKTVYSNKTFDYMACKKPILMAIDGVSRGLVERAGAGLYIEPEDPNDFAEKIKLYLSNPQKIKIDGENGYIFAKANFDREVLAKEYINNIGDLY